MEITSVTQQKHYQGIEPEVYIHDHNMDFDEGNVVKYITRHRKKDTDKDIRKILVYAMFILKHTYKYSPEQLNAVIRELNGKFVETNGEQ